MDKLCLLVSDSDTPCLILWSTGVFTWDPLRKVQLHTMLTWPQINSQCTVPETRLECKSILVWMKWRSFCKHYFSNASSWLKMYFGQKYCQNKLVTKHYLNQWWHRSMMSYDVSIPQWVTEFLNTLRPRQNDYHFPDDIFKCIFFNENLCVSIKISLKFVPKVPINNFPALVQMMAWRRSGDKPLSEPMMI